MNVRYWMIGLVASCLMAHCFSTVLAQPTPPAEDARIILQSSSQGGVEVAAWSPDDRYVLTASGLSGTLIIWDAAKGTIIDRLRLPASHKTDLLRLTSMNVDPAGRQVQLSGKVVTIRNGVGESRNRNYVLDLYSRAFSMHDAMLASDVTADFIAYQSEIAALAVLYEGDSAMSMEKATMLLPRLPRSHAGNLLLQRTPEALLISDGSGRKLRQLSAPEPVGYSDAALSPDGEKLALVADSKDVDAAGKTRTTILMFNTISAAYLPAVSLAGDYGKIMWIDAHHFMASDDSDYNGREAKDDSSKGPPSPARVVDISTGHESDTPIPARCYMRALSTQSFVGAGLANCRTLVGKARGLQRFDKDKGWQDIGGGVLEGVWIDGLATSPDGSTIAVAINGGDGSFGIATFDAASGNPVDVVDLGPVKVIAQLAFASDSKTIIIAADGKILTWQAGGGPPRILPLDGIIPDILLSDGKILLATGTADSGIGRVDLISAKALTPLRHGNVVAGGFLPNRPLFWAASATDGLRLWDTRDWSVLLTTYQFEGQHFFAITPSGHYDTDLGADANQFRWLVRDAPFQPLAPQTFMRDFFEPRLTARLMDCTASQNCASTFHAVPQILNLNRVLPDVRITSVTPGPTPDIALVNITLREGVNPAAANGKTHSGIYNLRLFRNGSLVAQQPTVNGEDSSDDIARWRHDNQITPAADGTAQIQLSVRVPTGTASANTLFTAYAFNEDRVKSETTRLAYTRLAMLARKPRAYILAIGIDNYDEPRLTLRFAANDARLLSARLAALPGYELHQLAVLGESGSNVHVSKMAIAAIFDLLAGGNRADDLKQLRQEGIDAAMLDTVMPDDLLLIAYSGHGWADRQSNFYLIPADGRWPNGATLPATNTLISSRELTDWLRRIDAGEMAMIIDACHSAASVDANGFKPGPMGDSGLGQLAFDKGIRILAATQGDDVALEDARLRQGLLTYVLAGEGLDASGFGKADLNNDGLISMDEWLRYATQRLPGLSAEVRAGRLAINSGTARDFDLGESETRIPPKSQEPALFDFNARASTVVLRKKAER